MESKLSKINLQSLLKELCSKYNVVGASLSVSLKDEVVTEVSGVLNLNTDVEVTPDSLFQVGSISKVFTATLIMQLVEERKLNLNDKVKTFLPEFRVSSEVATESITIKHLLTHTSGIEGDFFPKDDPFNPTTQSLVDRCYLLPQLHPVGELISYCNTGYTIAGRIIEVLRGKPWSQVVQEFILDKIGLKESTAFPHEMIRYRAAIGHSIDNTTQELKVAPDSYLPLSHGPAGTVLSMSSRDLLIFAKAHLNYGRIDNKHLITKESAKMMQFPQFKLPDSGVGLTDWGLGWYIENRNNCNMYGHTGGTIGQLSYLSIYPEHDLIISLLTNSPSAMLFIELEELILQQLVGVTKTRNLVPSNERIDFEKYCGTYRNILTSVKVFEENDNLWCKFPDPVYGFVNLKLQHSHNNVFIYVGDNSQPNRNIIFLENEGQKYLSSAGRLYKAEK